MDVLFVQDRTPDSTLTALPDLVTVAALPDAAAVLAGFDPAGTLLEIDVVDLLFALGDQEPSGGDCEDGMWKIVFTNDGAVVLRFDGVIVTAKR